MASKHDKSDPYDDRDELPSSPHNIWLAGLGALAQAQASAQAEGSKAYEALVKQGLEMQARTQALAKEQWTEAAQQLNALTAQVSSNPWDRLGNIFQSRVARALAGLGMPPAEDIQALEERIAALEKTVQKLQASSAPKAPKAPARGTSPKSGKSGKKS